jgi:Na+/proline symporter
MADVATDGMGAAVAELPQTELRWLIASYVTSIFAVVAFAGFALLYTTFYGKDKNATTEDFITARATQSKWRIAWSFFAGAVGAWVIVGPASYAAYAGILGLTFYALASGLPIVVAGACVWYEGRLPARLL